MIKEINTEFHYENEKYPTNKARVCRTLKSKELSDSGELNNIVEGKVAKAYQKSNGTTPNSTGDDVKLIQETLQKMKINIGNDGIDGVFGNDGHNAIMTFQENYKPTHNVHQYTWAEPDGIVGKNTLLAMDEALVGGWRCNSKDVLITKEMLATICPNAGSNQELLNALNKYCPQYQINTPLRIAHFLAQTAHESGCFTSYGEGIHYRLSTALATWPSRNNDINKLSLDGRYLKQPDLFNSVYGTRNGNIAETNDGYNFRGRGLIQLTGRTNYTNYQASHNVKNSDDIQDFINNPDLVKTNINYTVESACWFWDSNQLNLLADQNTIDVTNVTKKVNGGTNGLTERQEYFDAVKKESGI